jgi:hypothetical protein
LQNCQDIIRFSKSENTFVSTEKARNRIEDRIVSVYDDKMLFIEDLQWKEHIKSIISVERKTSVFNTKENAYKDRNEIAVYVVSARKRPFLDFFLALSNKFYWSQIWV